VSATTRSGKRASNQLALVSAKWYLKNIRSWVTFNKTFCFFFLMAMHLCIYH
jgi:hypothetical protein